MYGVLSSTAKATTTWWAIERYASDGETELLLSCGRMFLWLLSRMLTTAYWLPIPLYEQQEWELYVGAVFLILLLGILWKRIYPLDVWALWVLMALVPFALLTEGTAGALPVPGHGGLGGHTELELGGASRVGRPALEGEKQLCTGRSAGAAVG